MSLMWRHTRGAECFPRGSAQDARALYEVPRLASGGGRRVVGQELRPRRAHRDIATGCEPKAAGTGIYRAYRSGFRRPRLS